MTREKLGTDNVYSFPITQQTQIDRNRAVDFRKILGQLLIFINLKNDRSI